MSIVLRPESDSEKFLCRLVHLGVHHSLVLEQYQLLVLRHVSQVIFEHLALLPHPRQTPGGGEVEQNVGLLTLVGQPCHPPPGSDLVPPEFPLVALGEAKEN